MNFRVYTFGASASFGPYKKRLQESKIESGILILLRL